jgi:hypothetical protein
VRKSRLAKSTGAHRFEIIAHLPKYHRGCARPLIAIQKEAPAAQRQRTPAPLNPRLCEPD